MINLLPPQGKKKVSFEYRMRVLSVYLILFGVSMLILGTLFLPSYFQIVFQKDAYQNKLGSAADLGRLEKIEEEFTLANTISDLLLDTKHYITAGPVIDVIWGFAAEGIIIQNVQLNKDDGAVDAVNLTGIAADRDTLISFRDNLANHEYFEEVDLPISDLTKNENIQFSISLSPAEVLTEPVAYEN